MNLNTPSYWDKTCQEEYEQGEFREYHYKFDLILKYVKGTKIADIGCGVGAFCRRANSSFDGVAEITGVDFSPREIEICREFGGAEYLVGSIYDIPLPSKTFDTVVCSEVLEHLTNVDKAVSELKRIAKDDGVIIITIPLNEEINYEEAEKGHTEHIRSFNEDSFKKYFSKIKFDYFRSNLVVIGEK